MDSFHEPLCPEPSNAFVSTPEVAEMTDRALAYLATGHAVHLTGPAGTGKTTLAFHLAARLGRPVTLVHGDDEMGSSDLLGRETGYRKHRLVDNFIPSVLKTEEELQTLWVDNRLTTACRRGDTLVYDEFNRSRPEANNALLSILSERILNLPRVRRFHDGYLEVHPEFRAILTSNSEEYAGVHNAPDALMDRLITITLGHYDRQTEVQITMARSGIGQTDAETIVDIVRALRQVDGRSPSVRTAVAAAQVLCYMGGSADWDDPVFQRIHRDLFALEDRRGKARTSEREWLGIIEAMSQHVPLSGMP